MILTSRIPPAGLGRRVLALPVHALDLAESAALARELPGLRGLLHADAGPVRDPMRPRWRPTGTWSAGCCTWCRATPS